MNTFHDNWGNTSTSKNLRCGQLVRFNAVADVDPISRYGLIHTVRSDYAFLMVLPSWWHPDTATYLPRNYQSVWAVPYVDIVESVWFQHPAKKSSANAEKQA